MGKSRCPLTPNQPHPSSGLNLAAHALYPLSSSIQKRGHAGLCPPHGALEGRELTSGASQSQAQSMQDSPTSQSRVPSQLPYFTPGPLRSYTSPLDHPLQCCLIPSMVLCSELPPNCHVDWSLPPHSNRPTVPHLLQAGGNSKLPAVLATLWPLLQLILSECLTQGTINSSGAGT